MRKISLTSTLRRHYEVPFGHYCRPARSYVPLLLMLVFGWVFLLSGSSFAAYPLANASTVFVRQETNDLVPEMLATWITKTTDSGKARPQVLRLVSDCMLNRQGAPIMDTITHCKGWGNLALTGLPAGGGWSGPFVSNGVFNPASANYGQAYTLTYTVALNGVNCTTTKVVTISNDCEYCALAPSTLLGAPNTITTISTPTTLSGNVMVKGPIVVTSALTLAPNTTVVFVPNVATDPGITSSTLCNLKTTPSNYAFLYITQTGSLTATKAVLRAAAPGCGNLEWQGLLLESGGTINLNGAAAEDIVIANAAEYGIRLLDCGSTTSNGGLTLNYVSMRETPLGSSNLTTNPASTKVYKFGGSRAAVAINNCRFEWGHGIRITSPHSGITNVFNTRFIDNGTAIVLAQGPVRASGFNIVMIEVKANLFENCKSECLKLESSIPSNLFLECNAFTTGEIPVGQTRYGVRITSTGTVRDLGSIDVQSVVNPPGGNAWPIANWSTTPKVSPSGWVSLVNENLTSPASVIRYHRFANEELGDTSYLGWDLAAVSANLYTGSGTPPVGSVQGCQNSFVSNGPYFLRMAAPITDLEVVKQMKRVRVYPNPFSDNLTIKVGQDCNVSIFDLNGREMVPSWERISETEISISSDDLTKLKSGIFVFRIFDKTSNTYHYERVVKE